MTADQEEARQNAINALLQVVILKQHLYKQIGWWESVRVTCLVFGVLTAGVLLGFALARLPWWTCAAVFILGFFFFSLYSYAKANLREMSILIRKLGVYAK